MMAAPNAAHLEDPFGPDPPPQPTAPVDSTKQETPEEKLKDEAKTLRDRIWKNYKTLRKLVAKYHDPIVERWRGFTKQQRDSLLETAWKKTISTKVEIPGDRFPQAKVVFELEKSKLEGREPSIDARQHRMYWLLPQLNKPSLAFDRSFLVLLIERARNHPWKFSSADEARLDLTMRLSAENAFMVGQLGLRFQGLEGTVEILTEMPPDTGDEGRDLYGQVVSLDDKPRCLKMLEAIELLKEPPEEKAKRLEKRRQQKADGKGKQKEAKTEGQTEGQTDDDAHEKIKDWTCQPDQGIFLLQAQDFLYRFLVSMSMELKSGVTEPPADKFRGVRDELNELTTITLRYDEIGHEHFVVEWPYRVPKDLDIEYIRDSLSAGLERWLQHLTALRTNADYFRKFVTLQYLSYLTRLQNDPPGTRARPSVDDEGDTILECVYDAMRTACYWQEMSTLAEKGFDEFERERALLAKAHYDLHTFKGYTAVIRDEWPDDHPAIEDELDNVIFRVDMIDAGFGGETALGARAPLTDDQLLELDSRTPRWPNWREAVPKTQPSSGSKDQSKWSRKEWLLEYRDFIFKFYEEQKDEIWNRTIDRLSPLFDTLWMTLGDLGEQLHWGLYQPQLRLFLRRPRQSVSDPDGYEVIGEDDPEGAKMGPGVHVACLEIIRLIRNTRLDCAQGRSVSLVLARATELNKALKRYEKAKTLDKNWHPWLERVNHDIISVATILQIFVTWVPEGKAVEQKWPEKRDENRQRRENFKTVLSTIEVFLILDNRKKHAYMRRAAAVAQDILGNAFRSGFVDPVPDSSDRQGLDQLLEHFWYCIHREAVGAPEDEWYDHPYGEGAGREFSKSQTKPPTETDYERLAPGAWFPQQRAHMKDHLRESYAWRQLVGDPDVATCPDINALERNLEKQGLSCDRLEKAIEYARRFAPPETEEIEVARTPGSRSLRSRASAQSLRSAYTYDIEPTTPATQLLVRTPARASATPGTGRLRATPGTGRLRATPGTGRLRATPGTGRLRATPGTLGTAPGTRELSSVVDATPLVSIRDRLLEEQRKAQVESEKKKKPEKKDSPRTAKRKRKEAGKEKKRKEKEAREEQDPDVARRHRQATTPPPSPTRDAPPKRKFYLRNHAYKIFEWMLRPDVSSKRAPSIPWDTVVAALRSGMSTRLEALGGSAFRFHWEGHIPEDFDNRVERYHPGDYNPGRPKSWHMPHGTGKGSKMNFGNYRNLGEEFKKAWDWQWDRFELRSELNREERRAAMLAQGQQPAEGGEEEKEEDVPELEEEAATATEEESEATGAEEEEEEEEEEAAAVPAPAVTQPARQQGPGQELRPPGRGRGGLGRGGDRGRGRGWGGNQTSGEQGGLVDPSSTT